MLAWCVRRNLFSQGEEKEAVKSPEALRTYVSVKLGIVFVEPICRKMIGA